MQQHVNKCKVINYLVSLTTWLMTREHLIQFHTDQHLKGEQMEQRERKRNIILWLKLLHGRH